MHVIFGNLLLCIIVYVSAGSIQGAAGVNTCITLANGQTSRYLHAFESLPPDNEHVQGCASQGSASSLNETYRENHVINVKNDRAADIYLNINGIHHRTTNTLPHYKEYKYEFALFSKKDVIWLVSMENMPNSSVFTFYLYDGSQIIARDGRRLNIIRISLDASSLENSGALLNLCRTYYFTPDSMFTTIRPRVTSFTEFKVSKIASVNIPIGYKKDLSDIRGNFTSCRIPEKNYVSPLVTVRQYDSGVPEFVCERNNTQTASIASHRAFVLDLTSEPAQREGSLVINLEITGKEVISSKSDDTKTIIVLRSSSATRWNIRPVDDLKSINFLFIAGSDDEVHLFEPMDNSLVEYKDWNNDVKNSTDFDKFIERSYNCSVVTYSKYSSPVDLVFLTLSDKRHELSDGLQSFDDDEMNRIAHDIYQGSKNICGGDGEWVLIIPQSILKKYGMTAENLKLGIDGDTCHPIISRLNLKYTVNDCSTMKSDGTENQLSVIFRIASSHFYSVKGEKKETSIDIPMFCKDEETDMNDGSYEDSADDFITSVKDYILQYMSSTCSTDVLKLSISKFITQHLVLTGLEKCKTFDDSEDLVEYTFERYAEETCGATFQDGLCMIRIPIEADIVEGAEEYIILSCRDSSFTVTANYRFEVFQDFSLNDKVNFPASVKLDDVSSKIGIGKTRYHIKVSVVSNDPSLTVYLSQCMLVHNSMIQKVLIRNNCPADKVVSFIRPYESHSKYQHFVVQIGEYLKKLGALHISCDVSSCNMGSPDNCSPTVPQCFHPHGDSCSKESHKHLIKVSPYFDETVKSGDFLYVTNSSLPAGGKSSMPVEGSKLEENGEENNHDGAGSKLAVTNWPILLILAVAAFSLGAIFISVLWIIDKKSYSQPKGPRTPVRNRESNSSGESGGSRSTGSTKTNGSSFTSLCFKTHKKTSPRSSKDDLEMETNPLIKSATSKSTQPQMNQPTGEKPPNSVNNPNPVVTMRDDRKVYIQANGGYQRLKFNTTLVNGDTNANSNGLHKQSHQTSTPPSVTSTVSDIACSQQLAADASVHIPHTDILPSIVRHTSLPQHNHLSSTGDGTGNGTSSPSQTNNISQSQNSRQISVSIENDRRSTPTSITKDEFDKLKEVTL